MTEIQEPKFEHGQFVKRVKGNSTNGIGVFRIANDAKWDEHTERYFYGISYQYPIRDENKMSKSGGSSYSWPESDFAEVDDPIDLLIIAKFERSEELVKARGRISQLDHEIKQLDFSLNLINPKIEEGEQYDS